MNLRRPERARDKGSTGSTRSDIHVCFFLPNSWVMPGVVKHPRSNLAMNSRNFVSVFSDLCSHVKPWGVGRHGGDHSQCDVNYIQVLEKADFP